MATRYQILKNLLLRDLSSDSKFFFIEMFVNGLSFNSFKEFFSVKKMAARGRGHFSINGHLVNFAYFQHISAITFTKVKLFSPNFTNLFTITRATF